MHKNPFKFLYLISVMWNFPLLANSSLPPSPLLELYSASSLNIPKTVYSENDFDFATFTFIYGAKFTGGPFDIRWYQSTGSLKPSEFGTSPQNSPCWSVGIKVPQFPLSFYAGTLGTTQTASRLRSPSFYSNPSPTATSFNTDYGLGIMEAQKQASSKPVAAAVSLKKADYTIEALINENQDFYAAAGLKIQPGDFIKTELSLAFANFMLVPKPHTEWKNSTMEFMPQRDSSLFLEALFALPLLKVKLYGGLIQNPFNTLRLFGAGEFFFHYSSFSLNGGFYCSDTAFLQDSDPFYTVSGSQEKSLYQIKLNPQLSVRQKKCSYKTGLSVFYDKVMDEAGYRENFTQKLTVSGGGQVTSKNDGLSLLYKMQLNDKSSEISHSIQAAFTHWFKELTFSVTLKEAFTQNSGVSKIPHTETINLTVRPAKKTVTQATLGLSTEHKNGYVNAKLNCSISGNIIVKNVKIMGKIQVYTVLVVE